MMNETNEAISKIHNYALEEIMGERFGRYSKYIIQDRAIPDVRDGLKPVQRRILWAMYNDKNTHDKQFKKCANAVGIVLGKYHPHGDSSVYDALIRMSQDWKQNHILVEVDGNNGSIDGDPPAAMRYTETRLAEIANEMLKDIEKNTVSMALNYSDTLWEPTVLPSKLPNLLINGTTGISAGYATNIPPHNLNEVIDATIKRIESPNCRFESIFEIIKGPDFPTGGIVEGLDGIRQAFETGKGKVIVTSKYKFEKTKGKDQIIISEIPFEVNKQMLVKKIDDIRIDNKISGIAEVRDESDKDDSVRIVIDLKAGADKNIIMNYLLKNTELQCNYSYNMVVIANRRPKLLGIVQIIDAYIDHIKEVVKRRSEYDLKVAQGEIHITEGLVKAISIMDDVIRTIRASKNRKDAEENLCKEYNFTPIQSEAIVKLQLYRLTNTDIVTLEERLKELKRIIEELEKILGSEDVLCQVVKKELRDIKKKYGKPRRTEISETVRDISISAQDLIVKEQVIVTLTAQGYIKKVPMKSFTAANGEETGLKPGDYVLKSFETNTLNKIIVFTKLGNYIYVPINDIPFSKWKDLGKHISNIVTTNPNDEVVNCYVVDENNCDKEIIFFTKNGLVKRSNIKDYVVQRYTKLYSSMKLKEDDVIIDIADKLENTLIITESGYYISYKTEEIPYTSGKSSGVKGVNLKDDYVVAGLTYDESGEYLNIFTNQKTAKRVKLSEINQLTRAKRGSTVIKKVKTTNYEIIDSLITTVKDRIGIVIGEDIIEIKNTDIPIMDLASTGSAISKKKIDRVYLYNDIEVIEEAVEVPKPKKVQAAPKQEELDFASQFKI